MPGAIVVNGTTGNDTLVVTATGVDSVTYVLNSDPPVTETGITSFTFNGLAGDDTFTIVNPAGGLFAPTGGISYDGGSSTEDNRLEILGGSATVGSNYISTTNSSGTITHDSTQDQIVTFTNVGTTPILDTVSENFVSVFAGSGGSDTITVTDGSLVDGGPTTVIDGPGFVGIQFRNKAVGGVSTFLGTDTLVLNNPTSAAGLGHFSGVNFGAVNQLAPINYSIFDLNTINGPVTLTLANDVDLLAAQLLGAAQPFSFRDVDGVGIFAFSPGFGVVTSDGAITITTDNGGLLPV